jgi:hypothetical protein
VRFHDPGFSYECELKQWFRVIDKVIVWYKKHQVVSTGASYIPMLLVSVPFMVDQPRCSPTISRLMVVVYSFDFGSNIFQLFLPVRDEVIATDAFGGAW